MAIRNFIIAVVFLALGAVFSGVGAQEFGEQASGEPVNSPYVVTDVTVTATASDAMKARVKAMGEADKQGLAKLLEVRGVTPPDGWLDQAVTAGAVSEYQVQSEKVSGTRYEAVYRLQFDPVQAEALIAQAQMAQNQGASGQVGQAQGTLGQAYPPGYAPGQGGAYQPGAAAVGVGAMIGSGMEPVESLPEIKLVMPIRQVVEWVRLRRQLEAVPVVRQVVVVAMAPQQADLGVRYQGDPLVLMRALMDMGYKVTPQQGYWIVQAGETR